MSNNTENFQTLLEYFERREFDEFLNFLDSSISISEFCSRDFMSPHQSFLHMICELDGRGDSVKFAEDILIRIKGPPNHILIQFVNQREFDGKAYSGRTPLEIAILNKNQVLIDLLVGYCADVTYALQGCKLPLEEIYTRFQRVMINRFDRNLRLNKNYDDESNELLWTVDYSFRPIVGVLSVLDKNKFLPSELLVTVLPVKTVKRNEILTHPLTKLFIHHKTKKFKWWIRLSIAAHVIWYIWTALFLTSLMTNIGNHTERVNNTDNDSISAVVAVSGYVSREGALMWFYYILYYPVFFGFATKEYFELQLAPNKLYYWKQFENIGQWMLLPIVVFASGWKIFVPNESQVGILISILLVQGQLTKTQTCGVYNILLRKAFVRFLKFSFAYSPLLIAFPLVFNLLLHKEKKEFDADFGFVKMFTVFAGELDYKETFDEDLPYHSIITGKVFFVIFVTIVTIILQNILVALTVDDIQSLKQFCLASHIAAELELIYILEGFESMFRKWRRRATLKQMKADGETRVAAQLVEEWSKMEFESFPENIQTCIKLWDE